MQVAIKIQDPQADNSPYLIEEILATLSESVAWHSMFAFASARAICSLFEDEDIVAFLEQHTIHIIVGIDSITNRVALEKLDEFQNQFANLTVEVFANPTRSAIFHPKLSWFQKADGSIVVIAGSGNLTQGGLSDNYEGYAVISCDDPNGVDFSSVDAFLHHNAPNLRAIDEELLSIAEKNVFHRKKSRPVDPGVVLPEDVAAVGENGEAEPLLQGEYFHPESRVLLASVPKAGGRWNQVHLNRHVVDQFFRVEENSTQRAFIHHVQTDGSIITEPARKIIFSHTNKNLKIELSARKGEEYPDPYPIAVFVESQPRVFYYLILFPGEDGFVETNDLMLSLPSLGRGFHRSLTTINTYRDQRANCPVFKL
jgi:hypothetical protein